MLTLLVVYGIPLFVPLRLYYCDNAGEAQQQRKGGLQHRKRKRVQDLSSDEEELEGTHDCMKK